MPDIAFPVPVALIDSQTSIKNELASFLKEQNDVQLLKTCSSVDELLKQPSFSFEPKVVLMRIKSDGKGDIAAIEKLKRSKPNVEILIWASCSERQRAFEALGAGANGYLLSDTTLPNISKSILELASGGAPMSPSIARNILTKLQTETARNSAQQLLKLSITESPLTPREQDVVRALVDGLAYKQIAKRLDISLETVRQHIKNIYSKLQIHSKSELISKVLHGEESWRYETLHDEIELH